jgi:hypothetical protein
MTHVEFVNLLDKWNIPHVANDKGRIERWFEHNRNTKGKWDSVFGIGNHHTGGNDDPNGASVLWHGYAGLPGPLCHAGIKQNGYVLLNGWGRTNHFGLGDDDVLQHVIHEDYRGILKPNEANTDGNRHFYGFEWMYNGLDDPMTKYPKLYSTAVRLNAAICTFHGWKSLSAISHGEWQPGKWDPGMRKGQLMDMARFRNHVDQAIQEGPAPKPPTKPKPTTKEIVIQKGDTLSAIAKKYSTTVIDLVNLNSGLIQPGDRLVVPVK